MEKHVSKSGLYSLAKCLTTVLVVIAHASRMYSSVGAISVVNDSPFLDALTTYIYAFHMPLFMLLSGCVFGLCIERGKYSNVVSFLKNKSKKLLLPYIIFGVLYVAPVMYALGLTDSFSEYVFRGILLSLNSRHLWYILELFWIFLIYIFMRPLLRKGHLGMFIVGVISLFLCLLSRVIPSVLQLSSALGYQLFFFFGILVNRYYSIIDKGFQKLRFLLLLSPIALLGVLFFNPNSLTVLAYKIIGVIAVIFCCWWILRCCPSILDINFTAMIQRNAFGIYLFHPMIIYVLYYLFGRFDIAPMALCMMIIVVSTVISILATELLRKTNFRWLIGE